MSLPRVYLVSKRLDPVLGIASGIWAYYLYESRVGRPQGHSLNELVGAKWTTWRQARANARVQTVGRDSDREERELLKEIEREVKIAEGK
ncbi:Nce101 protein [Pseudohyphozyma bogoriensis]|nr:Nce101 protein [Pseudohyphozyma bogoriensis]